ncbi:hypothetical protein HDV05_000036 [Chytridiales sp. JEL 0842]|nr:hypothetical protein HDV05_000036 [Chytridiales sp. JEL 0842]
MSSDSSRNRCLRQFRGKLSSLQIACESAPSSVQSFMPGQSPMTSSFSRMQNLFGNTCNYGRLSRDKLKGKREGPKLGGLHPHTSSFGSWPDSSSAVLVSSPLYKHVVSIQEHFRDSVEKLWWQTSDMNTSKDEPSQGSEEATDATSDKESGWKPLSLLQLSSFAVARDAPIEVDQNELITDDDWYEAIPSHLTSLVLLQHLVELCKEQITIPSVFEGLIDICLEFKAYYQGADLLKHMWSLLSPPKFYNYMWAYEKSLALGIQDNWIAFLCDNISTQDFAREQFQQFWLICSKKHTLQLACSAVKGFVLGGCSDEVKERPQLTRTTRGSVHSWITRILEAFPDEFDYQTARTCMSTMQLFCERPIEYVRYKLICNDDLMLCCMLYGLQSLYATDIELQNLSVEERRETMEDSLCNIEVLIHNTEQIAIKKNHTIAINLFAAAEILLDLNEFFIVDKVLKAMLEASQTYYAADTEDFDFEWMQNLELLSTKLESKWSTAPLRALRCDSRVDSKKKEKSSNKRARWDFESSESEHEPDEEEVRNPSVSEDYASDEEDVFEHMLEQPMKKRQPLQEKVENPTVKPSLNRESSISIKEADILPQTEEEGFLDL